VTLVTPAYNQAEYLAAAVASVLAQTYPNIEYLVVDDGSTDATPAVLRSLGGRVRWHRQDNRGQALTLNEAWRHGRGEVLAYLSSDDLLEPNAVARAVEVLQAHPEAVACYGDFTLIDGAGRQIRRARTEPYDARRLVVDLVCLPGPGAFFRRSAFEHSGGWNPALRQIPDFDFWLRLSRCGPFVRVPASMAAYRIHDASASFRQASPERADEIVRSADAYWADAGPAAASRDAARSRAMARLIAARTHLNAGRLGAALQRVAQAGRLAPSRLTELPAWRMLAGGLLRRTYYVLRAQIGRRDR
jgi:glycosyltransferase involved in cell wall biosynthesis